MFFKYLNILIYAFNFSGAVPPSENLFSDTLLGTRRDTTQKTLNYVPVFVDKMDNRDIRNGTNELCGNVMQCVFDYQVTGNKELAKSTLKAVEKFKLIQENIKKGQLKYYLYWFLKNEG